MMRPTREQHKSALLLTPPLEEEEAEAFSEDVALAKRAKDFVVEVGLMNWKRRIFCFVLFLRDGNTFHFPRYIFLEITTRGKLFLQFFNINFF